MCFLAFSFPTGSPKHPAVTPAKSHRALRTGSATRGLRAWPLPSKDIGHGVLSRLSQSLLFPAILALLFNVLFVNTSSADSCSSVQSGAKVDPIANIDQDQPPGTCSVRNLSASQCDSVPGNKHFKKDSGSGFTECFFDPPSETSEPIPSTDPSPSTIEPNLSSPDETDEDNECTAQLTAVEGVVHDKIESNALSEADAEKANELLDEADALCTEGKFADATATLATVKSLVAKGK
jgi:hypothetical protein